MSQIERVKTKEEREILSLQERIRIHTQLVRNWGYYRSVMTICKDIYRNVNNIFDEYYGVSATTLIDLFEYLINCYERNINNYIDKLREVFSKQTIEDAVDVYYQLFEIPSDDPSKFVTFLKSQNLSVTDCQFIFYSHSQLFTINYFIIDIESDEIQKRFPGIDFNKILESISLRFGELKEFPTEHIFLANPVWNKPLIHIDENKFFCSYLPMFFSHIFKILDTLGAVHSGFTDIISEHRSDYLECSINDLFRKAFNGADISCNYKWKEAKDLEYETDLIVRFDTYLLIVEAKSGKISQEALRGAPDRLKNDLNKVLIEPALQSQRLYQRILNGDIPSNFPVDLSNTRNILRVSISLEDFATVQ
jgi:hypothetical protein